MRQFSILNLWFNARMRYLLRMSMYRKSDQFLRGLRVFLGFMIIFNMNLFAQWQTRSPYAITEDSAPHRKCGFPFMLEAYFSANRELYEHLQLFKMTSTQFDSVTFSPSGRFKIYYQVEGIHAIPDYDRDLNGTPDYLEFVGRSFDRAWQIEIDSLGFNPPRDSSGYFREIYPVYCRLLRDYGITILDYEIPSLPEFNFVTYTEININYDFINYPGVTDPIVRDSMAIAITAAHEFNHASHSGYRIWTENNDVLDLWFIESSATYMEEVVSPEVNDYVQYLDYYFQRTNQPLDQSSGGLEDYGKVVLEIMLGERYFPQIMRYTWEKILEYRALPALDNVLQSLQTSFSAEFSLLSAWLYFTNERSVSGRYFPDGELFPSPRFKAAVAVQERKTVLINDSLPGNSFQWYFSSLEIDSALQLYLRALKGSVASDLNATLIPPPGIEFIQFPASISTPIEIASSQTAMPFGIVNSNMNSGNFYHFEMISNPINPVSSTDIRVFPQPFLLSNSQEYLQFDQVPENANLSIFNSQGNHIITLTGNPGTQRVIWDLKNSQGNRVGSGVYMYYVNSPEIQYQGKFVVIY